jgi:hypothetical protein
MKTGCEIYDIQGDTHSCYPHRGWHVNAEYNLDSTGRYGTLPPGLKFTLQSYFSVTKLFGVRMRMKYRMTDFSPKDYFRVLIDGQQVMLSNDDTIRSLNEDADVYSREGWTYFKSRKLDYGNHTLEVAVFSEALYSDPVSHARVEVSSIVFIGVESYDGGAGECIPVPLGHVSQAGSSHPKQCSAG